MDSSECDWGAEGEGDDRGWDGWMASLTRWTWVWVNSGSWWWTRRPGVLRFMASQRVRHNWATELNWTEGFKIGKGNGNPLQCSCLENPRDGRVWWAAVSGVAQSRTQLKRLSSSSSSSSRTETYDTWKMLTTWWSILYFREKVIVW